MPYMSQEDKKSIAPKIQKLAKKYGVKCSLAVRHHTTIVLNVRAGELDFIGNHNEELKVQNENREECRKHNLITNGYIDVRKNSIEEDYTGKCKAFLLLARQILLSMDYYHESDPMTDYYNVSYYVEINVGRWDKPYSLTSSNC